MLSNPLIYNIMIIKVIDNGMVKSTFLHVMIANIPAKDKIHRMQIKKAIHTSPTKLKFNTF